MADAGLKIRVGADVSDVVQKLEKVEDATKKTGSAFVQLPKAMQQASAQITAAVNKVETPIKQLATTSTKTAAAVASVAPAMQKVSQSGTQANVVLMNTGRVFQDLPFGIIGVANNINPLVESFGQLSRVAKETGVSVGKQLLQSLTGAGGLAFGFSIVTAALSFLTIGFSAFTRGLGGSKKAVDENKVAVDALKESMEGLKEATAGMASELQFLNSLGSINVKIRGAGDQQNITEQIFAQLEFNQKLVDQMKRAQQGFKDALAIPFGDEGRDEAIRAAQSAINAVIDAQVQGERDLKILRANLRLQRRLDAKKDADDLAEIEKKRLAELVEFAKKIEKTGAFAIPAKIQFSDFDSAAEELQKAINIISGVKNFTIRLKIGELIVTDDSLPNIQEGLQEAIDKAGEGADRIKFGLNAGIISPQTSMETPVGNLPSQEQMKEFEQLAEKFQNFGDVGMRALQKIDFTNFTQGLKEAKAALNNLTLNFSIINSVAVGFGNSISAFFDAILEKKNAFVAFFDTLKQSITQLISKLISALAQAALLSVIFPGAGAFGKFFFQGLGIARAAQGGIVPPGFGGDTYPALLSSGEAIMNSRQISSLIQQAQGTGGGQMSVRLRGRDLLLQSERTRRSPRR